ncbi:MAG: inverse autotransporter beta domain-containing protein [Planktomarina sp.]|nr:inverse autotransporter beta domain-containing protein [Planktomarina sp.]
MLNKMLLGILLSVTATSSAIAQDKVSEVKNALTNLAVGEGNKAAAEGLMSMLPEGSNVEVSINANGSSTNTKLSGHVMFVAPLKSSENSVLFNQSQISNYYVRDGGRLTLNLGLGYRQLSDDKTYFTGINGFFDIDSKNNTRMSVGVEYKASNFGANANIYRRLGSATNKVGVYTERVLNGHDMSVTGTLPYLPWADVVITSYKWDKVEAAKSSKGTKVSTELRINSNTKFEFGVDDNNIDKKKNFASIMFTFPGDQRPTLTDGAVSETAFNGSDVSKDLLMKVRRTNKIVLESKNVGVVVVRLD